MPSGRQGAVLLFGKRLAAVVGCVTSREIGPLLWEIVKSEDRRDGADRHASAAVDALYWIDVEQLFCSVVGLVFLWMDAIHRAGVYTRRIFSINAGFRYYVCHCLVTFHRAGRFVLKDILLPNRKVHGKMTFCLGGGD